MVRASKASAESALRAMVLARLGIELFFSEQRNCAELRAHTVLAARLLELGDRAGFDRAVDEQERLQRELRIVDGLAGLQLALQARMAGRFNLAERLAGQAFAEWQHYDPENAAQGYGAVMSQIRRLQGRLLEMEPAIKASAERYPAIP